jgi:predicted TPR repeat methyltransferase
MTAPDSANLPGQLLAAAYAVDGPAGNRALYAQWAETYESGFIIDSRYVYHDQVVEVFARHGLDRIGSSDVVVDVGCGTGLGGAALRRVLDVAIDGIDISPEMLQQAAGKQHDEAAVYRHLIEADLTQPLAIATHTYSGAISVGTFTHGHVGPSALAEVVRIIRPGGRAAIGVNAAHFATGDFDATLERLVDAGSITDLRLTEAPIYAGAEATDPDTIALVATFEVS